MSVSKENQLINQALRDVFGGKPRYIRLADEKEKSIIDILICTDSPRTGVTSFGTLGLSDYPIGKQVDKIPLGIEFVGASRSKYEIFPNILATCAFNIINSKFKCGPGSIFKDVVGMYTKQTAMKHIMFVPPFVWDRKLETLDFRPRKIITWLLAVPISDQELKYADSKGADTLETLFDEHQIDIFDLERISIL